MIDASLGWDALSGQGTATRGEFRVLGSGVFASEGEALFALDSRGLRHLLIPVRRGTVIDTDERSAGVHIVGRELIEGTATLSFVDIACLKPHLAEVFGHLASEMLMSLVVDPGRPATVARRALNRWREMLDRDQPRLLGEEAQAGLFGELLVLKQLVSRNVAAVAAWLGPAGSRFDFQRGYVCLEVKTTTSIHRTEIQIHGVEQLEPLASTDLYLAAISIERVNAAGESLIGLVQEIQALGVDVYELTKKLQLAGYSAHDAPLYSALYAVRSQRFFHVDKEFPRIVRGSFKGNDLPEKVGGLRYTVDLSAAPPTPMYDAAVAIVLNELARSEGN